MSAENTRDLLQDALLKIRSLRAEVSSLRQARNEPIAIVGAGCRFPGGACTPDAFWRLLREGGDAVGDMPPGRWDVQAFSGPKRGSHPRGQTSRVVSSSAVVMIT